MKPHASVYTNGESNPKLTNAKNPADSTLEKENLVEWARLAASQVRQRSDCVNHHLENLRARGEPENRLMEIKQWRDSALFTEAEKLVLQISETISLNDFATAERDILQKTAALPLPESELLQVVMAVLAVNDWMDCHPGDSRKVLIVEDNTDDQAILLRQLKSAGMDEHVIFVADASDALDLLAGPGGVTFRESLIAIFLDLNLPGMSGLELLQRIRIMPGMRDFPILVVTSSNHPQDIEDCKKLNVSGFIQKPVTFKAFSHAIAERFHLVNA